MNQELQPRIILAGHNEKNLALLKTLVAHIDAEIVVCPSVCNSNSRCQLIDEDKRTTIVITSTDSTNWLVCAQTLRTPENHNTIPIVFIIENPDDYSLIGSTRQLGMIDFLVKPLLPELLSTKIETLLGLCDQINNLKDQNSTNEGIIEKHNERIKVIEAQHSTLKEISIKDPLTGAYNRGHLQSILQQEFALAQRYKNDFCCFLLDLDYFKDVNDRFGHPFGDFVLQEFVKIIKAGIRDTDFLVRYGGEEFVLLLPHTDEVGGKILAERLRENVEKHVFTMDENSKNATVSIGFATFLSSNPKTPHDLVANADKALYQAKAGGRNQSKCYIKPDDAANAVNEETIVHDLNSLRELLTTTLERTRQNSLADFELLVSDAASANPVLAQRNQVVIELIDKLSIKMNFPKEVINTLKRASKLHDLFRAFIQDQSLSKDGPLDQYELAAIEDQPFMLDELTRLFDFFADERVILLHHHEHYNGLGYPQRLKENEIPLGARFFSVIEAFVAMTNQSGQRDPLPPETTITELIAKAGSQFDPMIIDILLDLIIEKDLLPLPKQTIIAARAAMPNDPKSTN